MPSLLSIAIASLALLLLAAWFWSRQGRRRRSGTLARMLDLADEVERLLDRCQERLLAMRPLVQRVPADIAAEARASLEGGLPIMEAKRDVLEHRLWIQRHGASASQQELDHACAALDRVRERLAGRLGELDSVGSELANATDAAAEAALREPPALRRSPDA